uniref:Mitochondrial cardiolipin hydrolase n=1 Tax=Albugo laibachii Nc14 TaxID=890382 RepID=F0WLE5_9STRA|nr:predicted protein putative [Albugo laibachii Nc14]CCA23400.1 predicted protein putative [Albugo laibachii Nc14]|eukprot:CCA23400.1 predicted protein putative [Albugo laibachii Nc14]
MGNCLEVSSKSQELKSSFIDVLFFPDPKMPCKSVIKNETCTYKRCKMIHSTTSLVRLVRYLQNATHSLDICVFTITCNELADEVIAAHDRGLRVRVITDDRQATSLGSDVEKFISAGIQVRDDNASTHMHHKFCIIDGNILLNGSFNWSRQAVIGNNENLAIHRGVIVGMLI